MKQVMAALAAGGKDFNGSMQAALLTLVSANRQLVTLSSKISEMKRVMTQSVKYTVA